MAFLQETLVSNHGLPTRSPTRINFLWIGMADNASQRLPTQPILNNSMSDFVIHVLSSCLIYEMEYAVGIKNIDSVQDTQLVARNKAKDNLCLPPLSPSPY